MIREVGRVGAPSQRLATEYHETTLLNIRAALVACTV